jgi:predicted transcriptional regulator
MSPKVEAEGQKVLQALAKMATPASNKEICTETNLDTNIVTKQIKKLKDAGYLNSPVRCKYAITESGKSEI